MTRPPPPTPAARPPSRWSPRSLDPGPTRWTATACLFPPSSTTPTAPSSSAPAPTRSAASPSAVPEWNAEKCVQCNQCAFVCPARHHPRLRPHRGRGEERSRRREDCSRQGRQGQGRVQLHSRRQPAGLHGLRRLRQRLPDQEPDHGCRWRASSTSRMSGTYMTEKVAEKKDMQDNTVKGSQFKQPMLEFSGSCAGCAETSYARLITQLFGDRMIVSTPPAARPSGAARLPPARTPSIRKARAPLGSTASSRTTPSTAWASTSARRRFATTSPRRPASS